MGCLGNLLWFVFGGAVSGLSWGLMGCLWCITVVGIPVGLQCFKFAALSFFPFGKEVQYGGGAGSFSSEYYLAVCFRPSFGTGTSCHWCRALYYHHRNSFWIAAV